MLFRYPHSYAASQAWLWQQKYSRENLLNTFFFSLLNDSWNFTLCAKSFDLIRTVDMDFFCCSTLVTNTQFISDFLRHIQYICLVPFVWQKRKCIWNELLKGIKGTGVWTIPCSVTQLGSRWQCLCEMEYEHKEQKT